MSDLIDRQAAIDALDDVITITGVSNAYVFKDYVQRVKRKLEQLPSAEPERKTGMWLFPYGDKKYKRCSVCEKDYYSIPHDTNFCPNCGADMRGEGHG